MTDEQFLAELRIRSYIDQIDGFPFGSAYRINFQPIYPVARNRQGVLDREATLSSYTGFTSEQRRLMLER